MFNLEFSVPHNENPETLEKIIKLKHLNDNSIVGVYLSDRQEYSGLGRMMRRLKIDQFLDVIGKYDGMTHYLKIVGRSRKRIMPPDAKRLT